MAEVIGFVHDYGRIHYSHSDGDMSGRYVREADYAALLERHRRLVAVTPELRRRPKGGRLE